MVIIKSESEKKPKKKFRMKHKPRGCGASRAFHFEQVGDDWLPIPKHLHRAFLAVIAAVEKANAEGKPILDVYMFDKYFNAPGKVPKSKPIANWKEFLRESKEKEAAKAKANSLKRKRKKAYQKEQLLKKEKKCV